MSSNFAFNDLIALTTVRTNPILRIISVITARTQVIGFNSTLASAERGLDLSETSETFVARFSSNSFNFSHVCLLYFLSAAETTYFNT